MERFIRNSIKFLGWAAILVAVFVGGRIAGRPQAPEGYLRHACASRILADSGRLSAAARALGAIRDEAASVEFKAEGVISEDNPDPRNIFLTTRSRPIIEEALAIPFHEPAPLNQVQKLDCLMIATEMIDFVEGSEGRRHYHRVSGNIVNTKFSYHFRVENGAPLLDAATIGFIGP